MGARLQRWADKMQLAALRGREQKLHNDIAGGYAKGKYLAHARREQQEVRQQIRYLEEKIRNH